MDILDLRIAADTHSDVSGEVFLEQTLLYSSSEGSLSYNTMTWNGTDLLTVEDIFCADKNYLYMKVSVGLDETYEAQGYVDYTVQPKDENKENIVNDLLSLQVYSDKVQVVSLGGIGASYIDINFVAKNGVAETPTYAYALL